VTLATALIEPPDWLLQAYREGRCRGTNELYDLRRLHGEHGDAVEAWAAQQPTITRDRLAEFRATLERCTAPVPALAGTATPPTGAADAADDDPGADAATQTPPRGKASPADPRGVSTRPVSPDASIRSDQRVRVEFEGHDYQLVVSVVPDHAGCMYVRPLTGGPRRLAPVTELKLLGFVGG
jgi:ParB family transcriptional regulator, chromosome partitioning protein